MILKEAFTSTYSACEPFQENPIWNLTVNWENYSFQEKLDILLEEILVKTSLKGVDALIQISKEVLSDFFRIKTQVNRADFLPVRFMQFIFCTGVIKFLNGIGRFHDSHDFIIYSIYDDFQYPEELTPDLKRIERFLSSTAPFISKVNYCTLDWFAHLFYYGWKFGGLTGWIYLVASHFARRIADMLKVNSLPISLREKILFTNFQLLTWSLKVQHPNADMHTRLLEARFYKESSSQLKARIAIQLSCCDSKFLSDPVSEWARKCIEEFPQYLIGHEEVQIRAIWYCFNQSELESNFEPFEQSTIKYLSKAQVDDPINHRFNRSRLFTIIANLITLTLRDGNDHLTLKALKSFYGLPTAHLNINNTLFILISYENGVLYCTNRQTTIFSKPNYKLLQKVIESGNRFLGTIVGCLDIPELQIEIPKHVGIPEISEGENFESLLSQLYKFSKLKVEDLQKLERLIIIPGYQHPIQSLMIKELGFTFPINTSLEEQIPQGCCRRVLLWCFGTLTSDPEREMVKTIFEFNNIQVESIDVLQASKEDFIKAYQSSKYDIIWVATHGVYDHSNPHKASIELLSDNAAVELSELVDLKWENSEQRLLFFNICDGATASTLNSMYDIGLGAFLASQQQAVLSHCWPTQADASLIYGLLYSHFIGQGKDFFSAYESTVQVLLQGKSAIENTLSQYDFVEDNLRWLNDIKDFDKNIYHWGSGVYYN